MSLQAVNFLTLTVTTLSKCHKMLSGKNCQMETVKTCVKRHLVVYFDSFFFFWMISLKLSKKWELSKNKPNLMSKSKTVIICQGQTVTKCDRKICQMETVKTGVNSEF